MSPDLFKADSSVVGYLEYGSKNNHLIVSADKDNTVKDICVSSLGISIASTISCIGRWVLYHERHLDSPTNIDSLLPVYMLMCLCGIDVKTGMLVQQVYTISLINVSWLSSKNLQHCLFSTNQLVFFSRTLGINRDYDALNLFSSWHEYRYLLIAYFRSSRTL